MSVDLNTALDDYADSIATATGYTVVRDPDLIHPPVVYIDLPEVISPTLGAFGVEIPLYVIGGFAGAQAGTVLLGMLPSVMEATGVALAVPETLTVGSVDFQTYKLTIPATIVPDTAEPPPVNPDLAVDNYSGGFVRVQYLPLLDDETQHDALTLGLAEIPGPNGVLLPDLAALEGMTGGVWYDHNGQLCKVKTGSGSDLTITLLARYIREHRTIDARLDLSEQPPVFHIVFAHLPTP